jgi:hypothetical protein
MVLYYCIFLLLLEEDEEEGDLINDLKRYGRLAVA